jgi:2-polyprenyl-3-methyl-5-hydroxy-6-metoxy-1,4-benzoquinol methylase
MPGRSKWLDPARIAHGLRWRSEALRARLRPPAQSKAPIAQADSFQTTVLSSYGVEDIKELDPTKQMWAEFTLTSAERGWRAVEMLGGPGGFRGKRVLDVGAAYGGFLVAAAHAGAKELVGVDVDSKLLDLARLLLADHKVEARLEVADITDATLPDRLGTFDIVFCNDVLEHVRDLDSTARNLAGLLKPKGRLFLEIPNGMTIRYIESDGHYKLPGITLLDHSDAENWFRAFYLAEYPYNTFFYAPVDYYLALFSRIGITLRLLNAPIADKAAVALLAQSWESTRRRLQSLGDEFPDKPQHLIRDIVTRAAEVDTRFRRLWETATGSPIPEERDLAATVLQTTFGLEAFLLEGRKLS